MPPSGFSLLFFCLTKKIRCLLPPHCSISATEDFFSVNFLGFLILLLSLTVFFHELLFRAAEQSPWKEEEGLVPFPYFFTPHFSFHKLPWSGEGRRYRGFITQVVLSAVRSRRECNGTIEKSLDLRVLAPEADRPTDPFSPLLLPEVGIYGNKKVAVVVL